MKVKTLLMLFCLLMSITAYSQMDITITLKTDTDGDVHIKKAEKELIDLKDADFSDGAGKLHIINKTSNSTFTIEFVDSKDKTAFKIPSNLIKVHTAAGDGLTDFNINNVGVLPADIPQGTITKGMGIRIRSKQLAAEKYILNPVAQVSTGSSSGSEKGADKRLYNYVQRQIDLNGYNYVSSQNIIIDKKGIVHIYLEENGNPIYSYFPATAKENRDKFQFHIISINDETYTVQSDAELNPVDISEEVKTNLASTHSDATGVFKQYSEFKSPIFGPYTTSFPFRITKTSGGAPKTIVDKTIKLLKTSRVSVGTAVVATWLKYPDNIATFVKPNGDTTLVADNKNLRGFLALFLTFHLVPRNLNIQPRDPLERIGISIGTNLTDKSFNNFFLGLNFEVTNGLFFNAGAHFGQVSYVVGHDRFDFGTELFTGTLETRKKWQLGGPYIAVNVDAALFAKVFRNILGVNND